MLRNLLVISVCTLVSACSSFSRPSWPWTEGTMPCTGRSDPANGVTNNADQVKCTEQHVLKTYAEARWYCQKLMDSYENDWVAASGGRFWLATFGTLSGAVFSPLAGGTAKTAWSGIAGSTNAVQASLDSNFSNAVNVRRRQEISTAGKDSVREVKDSKDHLRGVLAAMDIAYECRAAVGLADAAALKAITDLQRGGGPTPVQTSKEPAAVSNPTKAEAEANKSAEMTGGPAAKAAAESAIPSSISEADKAIVEKAGTVAVKAAVSAAAPVAASTATTAAIAITSDSGGAATLEQTRAAAQAAAQVSAQSAARPEAEAAARLVLPKGASTELKANVQKVVDAAVHAAAKATSEAAAETVAAPSTSGQSQPIDIK
ncbi:hypothetical protein N015_18795 [Pseudomonas asturiensis]|uniref:Lipoprotein n=1 Tax=Pseudomonas asturiensis TaxID=1190415 RepID=A0ABX6HFH1_9PSED|nr:hypothetical protein [Pseudomonas asturiensis]QHF04343.1 hypothetical protein N015_18795 [Pseudomonas asturiensis]